MPLDGIAQPQQGEEETLPDEEDQADTQIETQNQTYLTRDDEDEDKDTKSPLQTPTTANIQTSVCTKPKDRQSGRNRRFCCYLLQLTTWRRFCKRAIRRSKEHPFTHK